MVLTCEYSILLDNFFRLESLMLHESLLFYSYPPQTRSTFVLLALLNLDLLQGSVLIFGFYDFIQVPLKLIGFPASLLHHAIHQVYCNGLPSLTQGIIPHHFQGYRIMPALPLYLCHLLRYQTHNFLFKIIYYR